MAKLGMLLLLLAQLVTSALLIDIRKIEVYPQYGSIYGVFQASHSGAYAFNASSAREACELLGVSIADKAQVDYALKHGFETCKFGWIDEQVAVIPRIQANTKCGKGQVGLTVWRAPLTEKFSAFCFNSTDFKAQIRATSQAPQTTTGLPIAQTSMSATVGKKTSNHSASSESQSDLWPTSSSPSHSLDYAEEIGEVQAYNSKISGIGVGAIVSLTTIFTFLLFIVAAVWYFKMNRFCVGQWNGKPQKEYIETELRGNDLKVTQADVENHNTETATDVGVTIDPENESETES